MKNRTTKLAAFCISMSMMASMLAACGGSSETNTKATDAPKKEEAKTDAPKETAETSAEPSQDTELKGSTPRNETLYFAGQQWGAINNWNPLSANANNAMGISQNDAARTLVYETLFMYNQTDGSMQPLLGKEYKWDDKQIAMTVTLNPDAKWNDDTQVTADDVVYTFDTHVKYKTAAGSDYSSYIEKIEKVDDATVKFVAKLSPEGKAVNPLKVQEYCTKQYVMQKAYLQKVEERNKENADKVKEDIMDDCVTSGPYKQYYIDSQKIVLIRDDKYWGQAASMFGSLPAPKYIAHVIYADNAAGQTALEAGEVDVCQAFITNVQDLWEKKNLPISTYLDQAPYGVCTVMPSLFFNVEKKGLDQKAVRKAIAMATDFDQIISSAMSNQSPSFKDVPRSLMNPTEGEQKLVDQDALKEYQWKNKDVEGAKKLLDEAGIKDTDGDGIREYDGQKLSFKVECPNGWSDWNASLEIVAAAGKDIGIELTSYFPDADTYYNDYQNGNFDMCMWSSPCPGEASPWQRGMFYFSEEYAGIKQGNTQGNFGRYINKEAVDLLKKIPLTTDEKQLKEYYTQLSKIWLDEVPSFALMYRPYQFHIVNESVWTGFPSADDGTGIPPLCCTDGYGIKALYNLKNK